MQGYCGMEALPVPVGRLESIPDMATVASNALNPLALSATGNATGSVGSIAASAAPLLGSQVGQKNTAQAKEPTTALAIPSQHAH